MECALGLTLKSIAKPVFMKDGSMWYKSRSVFFALPKIILKLPGVLARTNLT